MAALTPIANSPSRLDHNSNGNVINLASELEDKQETEPTRMQSKPRIAPVGPLLKDPLVTLRLSTYQINEDIEQSNKKFVEYRVQIRSRELYWSMFKRYTDFLQLHQQVRQENFSFSS
jgi:hypothetical protein